MTMSPPHPQDEVYQASLSSPESFWAEQASQLHWHTPPSSTLRKYTKTLPSSSSSSSTPAATTQTTDTPRASHDHWEWFPDGEISPCYNCVDRHVLAGHGDAPAILYDSPVTKTKLRITYAELLREVEVFAAVLRDEGVRKGDVVLVYSEYSV